LNLPKQVGAALVARENPGRTWALLGRQTLAPDTEVLAQSSKDRTHTAGQVVVSIWIIAQGLGACNGEASEGVTSWHRRARIRRPRTPPRVFWDCRHSGCRPLPARGEGGKGVGFRAPHEKGTDEPAQRSHTRVRRGEGQLPDRSGTYVALTGLMPGRIAHLLSFAQYVGREMAESRRLERSEGFSGQP